LTMGLCHIAQIKIQIADIHAIIGSNLRHQKREASTMRGLWQAVAKWFRDMMAPMPCDVIGCTPEEPCEECLWYWAIK
jgi:hypothetical protein